MRKSVGFIHSTNMPIWKDEILLSLLSDMDKEGLINLLEFVFVCNIGDKLDSNKISQMYPKVIIQNYSTELNLYENATLRVLHSFCLMHTDYNILYLHTKGVSHEKNKWNVCGILSWIKYSINCLINHHEECRELLNVYDVVGTQYTNDKVNPEHYSGNFWWARSEYIKKLDVDHLKDKYDAEFWLFRKNPLCYNIYNMYHMYEFDYPIEIYENLITRRFQENTLYCKFGFKNIGLFNQLYCLVNTIVLGTLMKGRTIIVVDWFMTDITSNTYCSATKILDIEKMNHFLDPFGITLLAKEDVQLEVVSIQYGQNGILTVDITDEIRQKGFIYPKQLKIPKGTLLNELKGDPLPNKIKYIYVEYLMNGIVRNACFSERRIQDDEDALLDMNDFLHAHLNEWIRNISIHDCKDKRETFNYFLKNIIFHPQFYQCIEKVVCPCNVIHLRNEDDAILHWALKNKMSGDMFRSTLNDLYVRLIQKYFKKEDPIFVLSMNQNSIVIDFLTKNGYTFSSMDKTLMEGRERNAILDFLISQQCSGTFIGNVNLKTRGGSTFSYAIYNYLKVNTNVSKVLIDLENIFDEEYVES